MAAYFTLWSAACCLGVKFKMVSNQIHSAVMDLNVVSRVSLRSVLLGFGTLYALSVLYLILRLVLVFNVTGGRWPVYTQWITSVLGFLLLSCLIALQYHSLRKLKSAVEHTDGNQFRFKVQMAYILVLALDTISRFLFSVVPMTQLAYEVTGALDIAFLCVL